MYNLLADFEKASDGKSKKKKKNHKILWNCPSTTELLQWVTGPRKKSQRI